MLNFRKWSKKTEFYLLVTIVLLSAVIQVRSGQFLSGNNLIDLVRSMIIPALFAVGAYMVLISGGIDVSFTAIASLAMYVTTNIFFKMDYSGSIFLPYLAGAGFGLVMGALNAILIAKFKFQTLIVTLGTSSIFIGVMQGALAAHEIPVPPSMLAHGKAALFSAANSQSNLHSDMPVTVLLLIGVLAVTFFIMKYTMLGRGIFAVGGDEVSAQRSGFNVFAIHFFIYCFVGGLAGITGIARASMMLNSNPTNMLGMELTVIAAVVLGGTRVTGGSGSLTGVMLAVALITIMSNSLILIGIPTYWQKIFTGAIIIIGTGVSAYQFMQSKKRLANLSRET